MGSIYFFVLTLALRVALTSVSPLIPIGVFNSTTLGKIKVVHGGRIIKDHGND